MRLSGEGGDNRMLEEFTIQLMVMHALEERGSRWSPKPFFGSLSSSHIPSDHRTRVEGLSFFASPLENNG